MVCRSCSGGDDDRSGIELTSYRGEKAHPAAFGRVACQD